MGRPMKLKEAINALVAQHGGVRAAARAVGIDHAYLHRLYSGEKFEPSAKILRRIGLKKVVTYETIKPVRQVLVLDGKELEMSQ